MIGKHGPDYEFGKEYHITYYAQAEFKRRAFKCTKVEYHVTGRIKNMIFEQIK